MSLSAPSPLVSIILVVWDSASVLPRCLVSLSAQTIRDFEIILVDNGSTDKSTLGLKKIPPSTCAWKDLSQTGALPPPTTTMPVWRMVSGWLCSILMPFLSRIGWKNYLRLQRIIPNFLSLPPANFKPTRVSCCMAQGIIKSVAWPGSVIPVFRLLNLDWKPRNCSAHVPRRRFIRVRQSCRWMGLTRIIFSYHEDVDLGFRLALARISVLVCAGCDRIPYWLVCVWGSKRFCALSLAEEFHLVVRLKHAILYYGKLCRHT